MGVVLRGRREVFFFGVVVQLDVQFFCNTDGNGLTGDACREDFGC